MWKYLVCSGGRNSRRRCCSRMTSVGLVHLYVLFNWTSYQFYRLMTFLCIQTPATSSTCLLFYLLFWLLVCLFWFGFASCPQILMPKRNIIYNTSTSRSLCTAPLCNTLSRSYQVLLLCPTHYHKEGRVGAPHCQGLLMTRWAKKQKEEGHPAANLKVLTPVTHFL